MAKAQYFLKLSPEGDEVTLYQEASKKVWLSLVLTGGLLMTLGVLSNLRPSFALYFFLPAAMAATFIGMVFPFVYRMSAPQQGPKAVITPESAGPLATAVRTLLASSPVVPYHRRHFVLLADHYRDDLAESQVTRPTRAGNTLVEAALRDESYAREQEVAEEERLLQAKQEWQRQAGLPPEATLAPQLVTAVPLSRWQRFLLKRKLHYEVALDGELKPHLFVSAALGVNPLDSVALVLVLSLLLHSCLSLGNGYAITGALLLALGSLFLLVFVTARSEVTLSSATPVAAQAREDALYALAARHDLLWGAALPEDAARRAANRCKKGMLKKDYWFLRYDAILQQEVKDLLRQEELACEYHYAHSELKAKKAFL